MTEIRALEGAVDDRSGLPAEEGRRPVISAPLRIRAGHSIVELVFVMLMIALIVGIVATRISVQGIRVDTSAQQISSSLMMAQRQAVSRNHNVVVGFDTVLVRLRIHSDNNNDGIIDPTEVVYYVKLEDGVFMSLGTATARAMGSKGVNFTRKQDGIPAVTFTRAGNASEAGGLYLTSARAKNSSNYTDDTRALEIDRGTGRTNWYRFKAGAWQRGF